MEIRESCELPDLVCKTCKESIDSISMFSKKVACFQNELDVIFKQSLLPVAHENIKVESNLDLDCSVIDENSCPNAVHGVFDTSFSSLSSLGNFFEDAVDFPMPQFEVISPIKDPKSSKPVPDLALTPPLTDNETPVQVSSGSTPKKQHVAENCDTLNDKKEHQKCHVVLERLPIYFLPSDEEELTEEVLREFDKKIYSKKRIIDRPRRLSKANSLTRILEDCIPSPIMASFDDIVV